VEFDLILMIVVEITARPISSGRSYSIEFRKLNWEAGNQQIDDFIIQMNAIVLK